MSKYHNGTEPCEKHNGADAHCVDNTAREGALLKAGSSVCRRQTRECYARASRRGRKQFMLQSPLFQCLAAAAGFFSFFAPPPVAAARIMKPSTTTTIAKARMNRAVFV